MRAIFRTVSAMTLGLSSLTLGATAKADIVSLTYSDGYPAYSIHYRHGADCYIPDYRVPRHVHHHRHYGKRHKHQKHGKHHVYRGHGHPGYRDHDRHDYGTRHGHRDDHRSGYRGHRKYDGDQRAGGQQRRTHTAYARH
jgi:hypothetical protein